MRSASSWQSVKSSSIWSSTSTTRSYCGRSARTSETAKWSVRRSVASASTVFCIPPEGLSVSSREASTASGVAPGRSTDIRQLSLPRSRPARNAASSPARTSDDLPEPEGPRTATNRLVLSCSSKRWMSPSRPKNSRAWRSSNTRKPRYGGSPRISRLNGSRAEWNPSNGIDQCLACVSIVDALAEIDPRAAAQERRERVGVERLETREQHRKHPVTAVLRRTVECKLHLHPLPGPDVVRSHEDGARRAPAKPEVEPFLPRLPGREAPRVEPWRDSCLPQPASDVKYRRGVTPAVREEDVEPLPALTGGRVLVRLGLGFLGKIVGHVVAPDAMIP